MSMSDSNDSADTFWPGYVDAISNLAINLLFVIAVMAIVVIGATVQLSELTKRKDIDKEGGVTASVTGADTRKTKADAQKAVPAQADTLRTQAQTIKQQAEQIKQLQAQLRRASTLPAANQSTIEALGLTAANKKVDVVSAASPVRAPEGKNAANVAQGGVVVQFNKDVIELTKEESVDLTGKIKRLGELNAASKWRITVLVPKGFSEAIRLGFYRANVVRNLLLQQGVQGNNIDLRVLESERGDADSARVVVRPGA